MTDPTGASANMPAPAVGLALPKNPAVEAALDQANAAKQAYRDDPSADNKAAYNRASNELRYQRWIARGGPSQSPTKATQVWHDRYNQEG
jgi:hypothetical protein